MAVSLIDAPGGQRRVETGVGIVTKIEGSGGRNVQVHIKADHLRLPVTGWADTHDAGLIAAAEGALASRQQVEYRVETKRKAKIDPGVPLDDVDKFDRVRDLVAIAPVGSSPLPVPTASPRVAKPETPAAPPAPPASSEAAFLASASGDPGPTEPAPPTPQLNEAFERIPVHEPSGDPGPVEPGAAAPAGQLVEGKPWQRYNSDGSTNLGSYALQAAIGMAELAHRLQVEHRQRSGIPGLPTEDQLRGLARCLLTAADAAQAAHRSDGKPDRMDNSHARARGAVRMAVEVLPVPWGASNDDRRRWTEELGNYAAVLLRVAVELDQVTR